jgi:NAD dependent epimerase/dehydratase
MKWDNKSVFITGAGGFIGSHLTERLLELNADVTAFVRYNSRNDLGMLSMIPATKRENLRIIMGDLKDEDAIRRATKDSDIIFHLGSLIAIPYSYIHPVETIETNIKGTLNVMLAAKEHNIEKVIHTSTSEVYGTARYVPIDEKHVLQGQSPYSASKIGADKIAESFYCSFNTPVAIIRPFNTYGPRQSSRAVIPTIITQMFTRNKIYLGSLHPTRDYTYVADTVDGFLMIAESKKAVGEFINIGSNFEISIEELAKKILNINNKKMEIASDDQRTRPGKSEVERLWCNNEKAKNLLGWSPKITLDAGLKETSAWISDHIDNYRPTEYTT